MYRKLIDPGRLSVDNTLNVSKLCNSFSFHQNAGKSAAIKNFLYRTISFENTDQKLFDVTRCQNF